MLMIKKTKRKKKRKKKQIAQEEIQGKTRKGDSGNGTEKKGKMNDHDLEQSFPRVDQRNADRKRKFVEEDKGNKKGRRESLTPKRLMVERLTMMKLYR